MIEALYKQAVSEATRLYENMVFTDTKANEFITTYRRIADTSDIIAEIPENLTGMKREHANMIRNAFLSYIEKLPGYREWKEACSIADAYKVQLGEKEKPETDIFGNPANSLEDLAQNLDDLSNDLGIDTFSPGGEWENDREQVITVPVEDPFAFLDGQLDLDVTSGPVVETTIWSAGTEEKKAETLSLEDERPTSMNVEARKEFEETSSVPEIFGQEAPVNVEASGKQIILEQAEIVESSESLPEATIPEILPETPAATEIQGDFEEMKTPVEGVEESIPEGFSEMETPAEVETIVATETPVGQEEQPEMPEDFGQMNDAQVSNIPEMPDDFGQMDVPIAEAEEPVISETEAPEMPEGFGQMDDGDGGQSVNAPEMPDDFGQMEQAINVDAPEMPENFGQMDEEQTLNVDAPEMPEDFGQMDNNAPEMPDDFEQMDVSVANAPEMPKDFGQMDDGQSVDVSEMPVNFEQEVPQDSKKHRNWMDDAAAPEQQLPPPPQPSEEPKKPRKRSSWMDRLNKQTVPEPEQKIESEVDGSFVNEDSLKLYDEITRQTEEEARKAAEEQSSFVDGVMVNHQIEQEEQVPIQPEKMFYRGQEVTPEEYERLINEEFSGNASAIEEAQNNPVENSGSAISGEPDFSDSGEPDFGDVASEEPDFGNTGEPDFGNATSGEPDFGNAISGEPDFGNTASGEPDFGNATSSEPDFGEPDFSIPEPQEEDVNSLSEEGDALHDMNEFQNTFNEILDKTADANPMSGEEAPAESTEEQPKKKKRRWSFSDVMPSGKTSEY